MECCSGQHGGLINPRHQKAMVDQIFFVFSKEDDEFNATWHDSRPLPMIELENEW